MRHINRFQFVKNFGQRKYIKLAHTPVKRRNAMIVSLITSKSDNKIQRKSKIGANKRKRK